MPSRLTSAQEGPPSSISIVTTQCQRSDDERFIGPKLISAPRAPILNNLLAPSSARPLHRPFPNCPSSNSLSATTLCSNKLGRPFFASSPDNWPRKNGAFSGAFAGSMGLLRSLIISISGRLAQFALERPESVVRPDSKGLSDGISG